MCYHMCMNNTYSPKEFGQLIGRKVKTLQKWGREGTLKAHRSPTNRRYSTPDQYLEYRGLKAPEQEVVQDLIAIITVFGTRLPGLRSYKKVLQDAALHKDQA